MPNPLRPEPLPLEQAQQATFGEVGAVTGDVLVEPAILADPGLEAGEVRHRDDQPAVGREPFANCRQSPSGIVEMLQNVPHHHHVLTPRGKLDFIQRPALDHLVTGPGVRIDAGGAVALPTQMGEVAAIAGADLEDAGAGPDPIQRTVALAQHHLPHRLEQPVEDGMRRRVDAAAVEGLQGGAVLEGLRHRGAAVRTTGQPVLSTQAAVGRRGNAPASRAVAGARWAPRVARLSVWWRTRGHSASC